jgi:hypothetical protein
MQVKMTQGRGAVLHRRARQGEINAKAAETHKALGGAAGILAQNAQAAADARRAAIDAENARIQAIRDDFKRRGIP